MSPNPVNSASQILLNEGVIIKEEVIGARAMEIWTCWTTAAGIKTFFAQECMVELTPGGKYEMYFHLNGPDGQRGSEGCTILSFKEPEMLAFTWNSEPGLVDIRHRFTYVMLELDALTKNQTKLRLINLGNKSGPSWRESYTFFNLAWGLALENLRKKFEESDWEFTGYDS